MPLLVKEPEPTSVFLGFCFCCELSMVILNINVIET